MELRHLRYFVAVVEEGHITRAAGRLGMQQPPLSQQIRALEGELGVTLLVRGARGVTPTPAGAAFMEDAQAILSAAGRAIDRVRRMSRGVTGRLSVGFTTSAGLHPIVPDILRRYRASRPDVEMEVREGNAAELTDMLAEGALQIAVMRAPVARPADIAFVTLLDEELRVVLPLGHRLLPTGHQDEPPAVRLAALEGERLILVRRAGAPGLYGNILAACRAAGFEPSIAAEVRTMLANINLVAAGVGVSLVPASMQELRLSQVVYCRLLDAPDLRAPLTLAFHRETAHPTVADFLALAQARAGEWP